MKTNTNTDPAAFVAALLKQHRRLCGASLISLDHLADDLFNCDMPKDRTRTRREARREIMERTEGLPLRFDTPDGAVFIRDAVYRLAFGAEYPEDHVNFGQLPHWTGELQRTRRAA